MTTNQTIDGVPRSLLQSLYTDTVQQWGVGGNAASQLRALLDIEQPEPVAVAICRHCGWPHINETESCDDATRRERGKPGPVAVVLPQRDSGTYDYGGYNEGHKHGWNDCLDELKRLNTARPAHANPPPGDEPCGTHHDNDGLDDWRKS